MSSSRRVKKGPGRWLQSAKRQRFMELRARGWSVSAAGREVWYCDGPILLRRRRYALADAEPVSDGKLAISDACEQVANTLRTSFSSVVVKLECHDKRPPKAPRRSRDEGTIVTRAGVALVTVLTLALATGVRRLVSASCE